MTHADFGSFRARLVPEPLILSCKQNRSLNRAPLCIQTEKFHLLKRCAYTSKGYFAFFLLFFFLWDLHVGAGQRFSWPSAYEADCSEESNFAANIGSWWGSRGRAWQCLTTSLNIVTAERIHVLTVFITLVFTVSVRTGKCKAVSYKTEYAEEFRNISFVLRGTLMTNMSWRTLLHTRIQSRKMQSNLLSNAVRWGTKEYLLPLQRNVDDDRELTKTIPQRAIKNKDLFFFWVTTTSGEILRNLCDWMKSLKKVETNHSSVHNR